MSCWVLSILLSFPIFSSLIVSRHALHPIVFSSWDPILNQEKFLNPRTCLEGLLWLNSLIPFKFKMGLSGTGKRASLSWGTREHANTSGISNTCTTNQSYLMVPIWNPPLELYTSALQRFPPVGILFAPVLISDTSMWVSLNIAFPQSRI